MWYGKIKNAGISFVYIIAILIFGVITGIGTLVVYFLLQGFLFGRGDYLLFISGDFNIITVCMLMILIAYVFVRIKEKFLTTFQKQVPHLL